MCGNESAYQRNFRHQLKCGKHAQNCSSVFFHIFQCVCFRIQLDNSYIYRILTFGIVSNFEQHQKQNPFVMMKYGKDIKQHLCESQKRRNCDTLDSIQHRTERIFFSLVENNKQIDSKRCQRKMRWKKIEKRDIHTQDASYTKAHSNISSVNNTRNKWKMEKKICIISYI